MSTAQIVIYAGILLSLIGFAGVIYSMRLAARAKAPDISDQERQQYLRRFVPLNIGALMLGFVGLAILTAGLILS